MTSYWVRVGPKSIMTGVLVKRRKSGCRDTGTRKIPYEDEAEIGVMSLPTRNTRDCRQLPEAGRGKRRFFPRSFIWSMALLTLRLQISSLQNSEQIHFYSINCFKPPSLWYFVMVTELNKTVPGPGGQTAVSPGAICLQGRRPGTPISQMRSLRLLLI